MSNPDDFDKDSEKYTGGVVAGGRYAIQENEFELPKGVAKELLYPSSGKMRINEPQTVIVSATSEFVVCSNCFSAIVFDVQINGYPPKMLCMKCRKVWIQE